MTLTLAPGLYTIQPVASSASLNINDGAPPNTVSVIADDPNGVRGRAGDGLVPDHPHRFRGVGPDGESDADRHRDNGTDYQTVAATATILAGKTSTRA